jgi:fructose-1,6-bisphosphatase/inositol monophosphatase family enzyme
VEHERKVALDAARAAAQAIRTIYDRPTIEAVEKDGGKGPLTEADLASNTILIDAIAAAFPDDAILSEETVDAPTRLSNRRCWVIDPLDGTREFTEKVPQFVVSVGLAVDGQPAVGVLVNPATGEEFTGIVGQGATYNGAPCHVTTTGSLEGARLLVSASETKKGWFEHLKGVCITEPMGSVAYKFGLVAAGLADATFTPMPRNEWDLLGGVACVLAAGGRCGDGEDRAYTFNRPDPLHHGVNGNNGRIHDAVRALMAARRA